MFVVVEGVFFVKIGGLGDVIGVFLKLFSKKGYDVVVVMLYYDMVD